MARFAAEVRPQRQRPENIGEAIFRSLAAGVQGVAQGLEQKRANDLKERDQQFQNFMATMRFEEEQRSIQSQRIIDDRNMVALDKSRADSKERFRRAALPTEVRYAEDAKEAIALQTALQKALISQGLGAIPQFEEAGVAGEFTGLSVGGLPQFGALPGLGKVTQTEVDRGRFVTAFSPDTPEGFKTSAVSSFDQGLTPTKMISNAMSQYNRVVTQGTGTFSFEGATSAMKAQAATESGYSPIFRSTRRAMEISAYRNLSGDALTERLRKIKVHFEDLYNQVLAFDPSISVEEQLRSQGAGQ